jgi:hypothetical protein
VFAKRKALLDGGRKNYIRKCTTDAIEITTNAKQVVKRQHKKLLYQ